MSADNAYYKTAARSYIRCIGLSGFIRAAIAKARGAKTYFNIVRPELRFPVTLRIPSSDVLVYEQVFLDAEYEFQTENSPKVIIDAGANIGLASIYFANKFPNARIFAIEPEATNFELLKRNVAPYDSITAIHAALWNSNRRISLNDPGIGNWGFTTCERSEPAHTSSDSLQEVEAITIDRIMQQYDLDRIDILKVDIEGAEKEVFDGRPPWLRQVATLVIETHDRIKPGCSEIVLEAVQDFSSRWRRGENNFFSREDGDEISLRKD